MFHQNQLRSQLQRFLPLLLAMWLVALVPAARTLLSFEWTEGATGRTPSQTPSNTSVPALQSSHKDQHSTPLLLVAIHPMCSCTRATLSELETAAANWHQPFHATFLIYTAKPGQQSAAPGFDWHTSAYIRDAQRALNAEIVEDPGGDQASKLGALTSGEVLLYSSANAHGERRLLFSGGVTAGRGMEGDNGGLDALVSSMNAASGQSAPDQSAAHSPVYGCGLATLSQSNSGGTTR